MGSPDDLYNGIAGLATYYLVPARLVQKTVIQFFQSMTTYTTPTINIKYARFLDPVFTSYVKNDTRWRDVEVPSEEVVRERVAGYREIWEKVGEKILAGMCGVLDLQFDRPVIDVYVVGLNPRPFSDPIVLKSGYEAVEFPAVLAHELMHRLFSINIDKVYKEIFSDMFPGEPATTQSHVVVHAVLMYLMRDVLHDEALLTANIERSKKHPTSEYSRAWDIVHECGYQKLINEFKEKYKRT